MGPGTGEIRILRSVHAADVGKVTNPMQCRGQVEGGVAQALGATLFENVRIDGHGAVQPAALRRYRLPQYTDIPRTEVHFMETAGAIGPLGDKSMSESPFTVRSRLRQLPARRDRGSLHRAPAAPGPGTARPARSRCHGSAEGVH